MKILLFILFLFIFFIQDYPYPYKNGKPTSKGIDSYIKDNERNFIEDYQQFIKDTLDYVEMETEDLTEYTDYDSLELGRFYIPNEIVISNQTKFIGYELSEFGKYKKTHTESNKFVRSTVMHELTHLWFNQIIKEMRYKRIHISPEYTASLRIYPNDEVGSDFIEEGICEYMIQKKGEINWYKITFKPKALEDIINKSNKYDIKYKYASYFIKDYLNKAFEEQRVKESIEVLINNKPPSTQEIIKPELYFNRIKK
jgi:hypothetical protein